MSRRLLGIADLSDEDISAVLDAAGVHLRRSGPPTPTGQVLGLAFLQPSLRTRCGFAAAALRLGWEPLEVTEQRAGQDGGPPESLTDTLRVVSGYVDALVVRAARPLPELAHAVPSSVSLINGGDGGPDAEHPTQALVDLFAIEQLAGPVVDQHIAICGDLDMRAARSLIRLLARRPPRRLTLLSALDLAAGGPRGSPSPAWPPATLADVDVLYAAGLPHGTPEPVRRQLRVDRQLLDALPATGIVLSPMPVIDEIAGAVRRDPRIKMFEQSDLALPVRMAVLDVLARRSG